MFKHLIPLLAAAQMLNGQTAYAQDDRSFMDSRRLIGQLTPVTGDQAVVNLYISFDVGSARLTAEAMEQLDSLREALTSPELAPLKVDLLGHTDASGPADINLRLSEKRARAVRRYLLNMFEINPERLSAHGYGEERLLNRQVPNASENRRVEVVTTRPITETGSSPDGVQAIN